MDRLTAVSLAALLALSAGCRDTPPPPGPGEPEKADLTVLVPEYVERPDSSPPRLYSLKIDGKDFTEPKPKPKEKITLTVTPAPGKDTVEVVMTFYPVPYSKTVRKKLVKLPPGKKVTVDFNVEDKETPDWYEPIFYPSPRSLMREACLLAKVTEKDTVMDIGCGDGRLIITALKEFKAKKGIGLDINPDLVKLCQENALKEGVADRAEFKVEDALKMKDVSHADVVFIYLGEDLSARLEPLFRKTLKPGARVVSLDFGIGSWKHDDKKTHKAFNDHKRESDHTLYLWTIKESAKE